MFTQSEESKEDENETGDEEKEEIDNVISVDEVYIRQIDYT